MKLTLNFLKKYRNSDKMGGHSVKMVENGAEISQKGLKRWQNRSNDIPMGGTGDKTALKSQNGNKMGANMWGRGWRASKAPHQSFLGRCRG